MKKLVVTAMLAFGITLYAQTSSPAPASGAGDAKSTGETAPTSPPAQAPAADAKGTGETAPASPSAQTQQAPPRVAEPELIGVVYWLESTGNLKPLPRQPAKAVGHPQLMGAKGVIEIPEARASFRIKAGTEMKFVIRVANGIDPSKYGFYRAESKNNKREILIATVRFRVTTRGGLPLSMSKYGESSYTYTATDLAPGEYAFVVGFEAFSLGIDPQ